MLYDLIRPALFKLDAERAHRLTIRALSIVGGSGSVPKVRPVTIAGLAFPNPVGLAAGMDKDGEAVAGPHGDAVELEAERHCRAIHGHGPRDALRIGDAGVRARVRHAGQVVHHQEHRVGDAVHRGDAYRVDADGRVGGDRELKLCRAGVGGVGGKNLRPEAGPEIRRAAEVRAVEGEGQRLAGSKRTGGSVREAGALGEASRRASQHGQEERTND